MPDRAGVISGFLHRAGWGMAAIAPLAGDASNRRYLRLTGGPGSGVAVLMDAPPDRGEDVKPFINIAQFLTDAGFSAPHILASDTQLGLLLLEDLGDNLYARHLSTRPQDETGLYAAAVDVLVALHRQRPPDLASYDAATMAPLAGLAAQWYQSDPGLRTALEAAMTTALRSLPPADPVVILRDYHSENLLWLPGRSGMARVGLLDFQDAMLGHPAYDLVSLIHDARRDVDPETAEAMIALYAAQSGTALDPLRHACAVMSAQRNLRILGVFARLCLRDGKPGYLDHLPRVWRLLKQDLTHPALADLRRIVIGQLPPPDPSFLESLRARCPTSQPQQ